jgi:hypothetical protein
MEDEIDEKEETVAFSKNTNKDEADISNSDEEDVTRQSKQPISNFKELIDDRVCK